MEITINCKQPQLSTSSQRVAEGGEFVYVTAEKGRKFLVFGMESSNCRTGRPAKKSLRQGSRIDFGCGNRQYLNPNT